MSEAGEVGKIGWMDLTVERAEAVRDFYSQVVGWRAAEVEMGGYADYSMNLPESGETVAGVCHARGHNADLPAA
ncbi:MAG: VOC family protein [Bryobacteraceae bacterium]